MHSDQGGSSNRQPWPHAPEHRLSEAGAYFITAATYLKTPHFKGDDRLRGLQHALLTIAQEHGWRLEAWAVFANHYHFVAQSPSSQLGATDLVHVLGTLHARTATWVNRLDGSPGRKVWHNYWDTHLTYQRSYLARLNYTHHNAVKHGLVVLASDYPWCSARWLESLAPSSIVQTIYRIKTDRVSVEDNREVPPWP